MLTKAIRELLAKRPGPAPGPARPFEVQKLAAAALLVECARIDGAFREEERDAKAAERAAEPRGWLTAVKLAVAAGILLYLSRIIPFGEVFRALGAARGGWVVAGGALLLAHRFLGSLRLRHLAATQGMALTVRQVYGAVLITNFYGLFLPAGVAGGAVMWHRLRSLGGRSAEVVAVIVFNRLVDALVVVSLGLALPSGIAPG